MPDEPIIQNFGNSPAVRGTRLTVYAIMDNYFDGETAESIAEFYRITLEEAKAATDYIDLHMAELMPPYRKMLERDRQGNPPHIEALLAQSHEKFMKLKASIDKARLEKESKPETQDVPVAL